MAVPGKRQPRMTTSESEIQSPGPENIVGRANAMMRGIRQSENKNRSP